MANEGKVEVIEWGQDALYYEDDVYLLISPNGTKSWITGHDLTRLFLPYWRERWDLELLWGKTFT